MLSIIIVSYNVKYFLEQCLYSVQKAIVGMDSETIVIDNNSPDSSIEYLEPLFPWVQFVANKNNPGFGAANNQGWKMAKGDLILFLNPDTILSEDCLQKVTALFDDAKTGAAGIRMIDGSGRFLPESKRGFPSPATSFYKLSGLTTLFPKSKKFARYYLGHLPENETNKVDVLAGAFMIVRKEILAKLDGFDETFFMYGEDVDLSYRIQKLGFNNIYCADSSIIHFKGESTRRDFKYVKHFYQAMSIFVRKHYGSQSWWLVLSLRIAIAFRSLFAFARNLFPPKKTGPPKETNALLLATEKEAQQVMQILDRYPALISIQRIDPCKPIKSIADASGIGRVILCAGELSYTGIIGTMRIVGEKTSCFIHANGSKSIVGSSSKNTSGEVMALP